MTQLDLYELNRKVESLTQKVESAFVRDDQGYPDYAAHRIYHKKQEEEQSEYDKGKRKLIRDIVSWGIMGAISIVVGLLAKTYLLQVP